MGDIYESCAYKGHICGETASELPCLWRPLSVRATSVAATSMGRHMCDSHT